MSTLFWYALGLPFIIIAEFSAYVTWYICSNGESKSKKPGLRLDWLHQGEIASLHRQMREMTNTHRGEIDALQQKHRKEMYQLQRNYQLAERVGH